jgi:CBS domain-containing protein
MVATLEICGCMKKEVVSAGPSMSVKHAAALLTEKRVGTLPVVDPDGILLGVTSITRIVQIFLPDFVALLENIDFVKNYGALNSPSPTDLARAESLTVADIMDEPVAVEEDSSLIRALSLMEKHHLRDLPVVKKGRLVGIASRVDIGRAFLEVWIGTACAACEKDPVCHPTET